MLKLPKGLKKKKKGKKSKKDQELFTEEELEQYKREHQLHTSKPNDESDVPSDTETKPAAAAATAAVAAVETKTEEEDEWSKFKALTAGVDSILHKTQDDLDRIKSTSFFKRVPPPSEQKKLEEEEAVAREAERLEQERLKKEQEEANRDKLAEAVVELSESEEESEEAGDIFDTDYIDAITSGEVQLGFVPESPDLEVDDGPDPFDTSYAEKLIKGPEVSKRGKKLVSLGSAVEVLTGRVDSAHAVAASGAKRKPRRGVQDLLLDTFDEDAAAAPEAELSTTPEPPKNLLDDLADGIPDVPIDLSVSLHLVLQKEKQEQEQNTEKKPAEEPIDVVSEFDVLKVDEDDEFAELAAESLTKKEEVIIITQPQPLEFTGEVEANWAEFEAQPEEEVKEKPSRPPPPRPTTGPTVAIVQDISVDDFALPDDDPFDTTFAEKVLPGTEDDDDFEFDPRAEETKPVPEALQIIERDLLGGSNPDLTEINPAGNLLTQVHKDLLGGSTTDLSGLTQSPIAPVQEPADKEESEDFDPFDTSAVSQIVQPKEIELKFLEKELLSDTKLKHSLSDPDFDPRALEEEQEKQEQIKPPPAPVVVQTPTEFDPSRRKSSLSLNLQPKSVVFLVPKPDLLSTDHEGGKIQKPLTPYYPQKETITEREPEDPFDTSFVPDAKPTAIELNILEQDLITSTNLKHSLSDPDFDPRAASEDTVSFETKSDLLVVEEPIDIKVLTPAQECKEVVEEIFYLDPFDTSIAANIQPGKAELKLIENELLPAATPAVTVDVLDTLTDAQELGLGDKVLTPQAPPLVSEEIEEVDPFDTSFAENLKPGETEIKILETELIHK